MPSPAAGVTAGVRADESVTETNAHQVNGHPPRERPVDRTPIVEPSGVSTPITTRRDGPNGAMLAMPCSFSSDGSARQLVERADRTVTGRVFIGPYSVTAHPTGQQV